MSLMGFQKKKYLDRGVGGWVELYPIFLWIFGIVLTLQSPLGDHDSVVHLVCLRNVESQIVKLSFVT